MATSGSTNFTQTRDQIISDAMVSLGVYRAGNTVSSNDNTFAASILNKIMKALEGKGIHMWKEKEGTLFLTNNQNKYTLSSSATDSAGNDVVETTLTADGSGTSLTVSSTTGMTTGDTIVISLDDNTLQSTTITVNSTTSLTLGATLTSAASSGNRVGTYTTHVSKPLHIVSARFNNSDNIDRPVWLKGRTEFMQIPDKNMTGKVNQIHYAATIDSTTLYVWPTPDSNADRLKYSYIMKIEDFDSSSDNADLPTEWLECLQLLLEARLARWAGKTVPETQDIRLEAQQALLQMQLWDSDSGSSKIVPNYRDND